MTPEQEDAHWALQGKPLMRVWLAYRRQFALARQAAENRQPHVALAIRGDARRFMKEEAAELHKGQEWYIKFDPSSPACDVNGVVYSEEDL